jgi:ribonuclease Z
MRITVASSFLAGIALTLGVIVLLGAGGKVSLPTGVAPDRYVYYPGTEPLQEDEIRLIACGTGMPAARHSQAATCFLAEFGNGDKFLFDVGTGSMANVAALMIPYDMLDKVFLTHLHTDHMGDIDALWAGGWTAGRSRPLQVWGPSGARPEMGTKHSMEHFLEFAKWDFQTRAVNISPIPGTIQVEEFDYKGVNQVVYQKNGVTIRSIPAVHAGDGPVSYILEFAGLKVVIGGDTFPNKWFIEHAKGADLVIHEAFLGPELFVEFYNQPPQLAWRACCAFHTSGQAFGKVMSTIQPRQAVAFHFFNEEGTRYALYDNIRETYDGPLSMATDMMVWRSAWRCIPTRPGPCPVKPCSRRRRRGDRASTRPSSSRAAGTRARSPRRSRCSTSSWRSTGSRIRTGASRCPDMDLRACKAFGPIDSEMDK